MAVQHGNRGIVKKDLQLYYNREWYKSFEGESRINLLWGGHFPNGYGMPQEAGSNATNEIIYYPENPSPYSDYVLRSTALGGSLFTEYQLNVFTIEPSTTYCLSAWYAQDSAWNGNDREIFHCRIYTTSGNNPAVAGGGTLIRSVNIGGLTWEYRFITITSPADATGLMEWYVGYASNNSAGFRYYTHLQLEKGTYATPYNDIANNVNVRNITTTNLLTSTYSSLYTNWGVDGSGQGTIGSYSYIENNTAVRITDVNSNTRFYVNNIAGFSASTTYTFSVKYRKVSGTPTLRFQIAWYNSSSVFLSYVFPLTSEIRVYDKDGWQIAWYTTTSPAGAARMTWFIQDGDDYTTYTHSYDLKDPQIQTGTVPTAWTSSSTTSNTLASGGGLLDLSGNNLNANLTNVLFNGNGYYFNGSTTSVDTGYSILNIDPSQSFSIEVVVNFDALTSYSPSTFTISNVNTTTNVITTSVNHNLVVGDRISFYVSGGSLPSPLLDGSNIAPYYIISPTTNTFKVSTSSGGSEVDITTAGSGTITALIPNKAGMLFGRANYGGIGIYYNVSPTNVVTIWGYSRTTAGYYNTPIVAISTGITYLITVVFDALNGRIYSLYINGVSQGSASCPSSAIYNNSTVGNFSIGEGGQADGGGTLVYNPFKGSCPMQRIYRRALTADEVMQNFNATRKTYGL